MRRSVGGVLVELGGSDYSCVCILCECADAVDDDDDGCLVFMGMTCRHSPLSE